MTETTAGRPSPRTFRIQTLDLIQRSGEVESYTFGPGLTLVQGPRQSGKTTLFRFIDWILGAAGSAIDHFGNQVLARYVAAELTIEVLANGKPDGPAHHIHRSLDSEYGPVTRIEIDGVRQSLIDLDSWIFESLQWPKLRIPKGQVASSANDLVRLTFRNLLRHLYRREDSWQEFAYKEEEFHRQAVFSYLIGSAEQRYSGEAYAAGQAEKKFTQLQAQVEEALSAAQDNLNRLTSRLRIPSVELAGISALLEQRRVELAEARAQQSQLTADIRTSEAFDARDSAALEEANLQARTLEAERTDLVATLQGYREAAALIQSEQGRLNRAGASVSLFEELPVTVCPACQQDVSHRHAEDGTCFLCGQNVVGDARRRRLELEQRALVDELSDIADVILAAQRDLAQVETNLRAVRGRSAELSAQLNDARREALAPYVSRIARLASDISAMEQQIAALESAAEASLRVAVRSTELERARRELELVSQAADDRKRRVDLSERSACSAFARQMNDFLDSLTVDPWIHGRITLLPDDFAFYVGDSPWNTALGGEAKVLFFFAYSYALLTMPQYLAGTEEHFPGFVILDNPIQQGLPDAVVREVLERFNTAALAVGAQLIAAVVRNVGVDFLNSDQPGSAMSGATLISIGRDYG